MENPPNFDGIYQDFNGDFHGRTFCLPGGYLLSNNGRHFGYPAVSFRRWVDRVLESQVTLPEFCFFFWLTRLFLFLEFFTRRNSLTNCNTKLILTHYLF